MSRIFIARAAVASVLQPLLLTVSFAQETRVEEVIVTSTALRENPLEVAQPTSVLGGDDLRRAVAASLGETLSGELGVSSTYFGPSASQPVIRGLSGYRVQVLQDGSAALDVSSLSQDHAVSIESVVAEQIEVIKGPATLLYGSGAAGGLINVVTKRVPRVPVASGLSGAIELRGDTAIEERSTAANLDAGFGVLSLHGDFYDRSTDDVEIPSYVESRRLRSALGADASDARDRLENSASDARGGALGASVAGEPGYVGLSWNRFETMYGIPFEETAFIDMEQDRLDLRGEWRVAGDWLDSLHVTGAHNDYTHTEFEAPGEPGTIFEQSAYELRLTADHHWNDEWRGTMGTQYVDTDFLAIGEEAFVPPSITRSASVFAFEERHTDRWTLELGARAERQEIEPDSDASKYSEVAISASSGVVLKIAPEHALAVNVTRTQRHPQAAELYADGPHLATGRVEIGNANIEKETAHTIDVSLRANRANVEWSIGAFYNDYRNFIYLSSTGEESIEDELPIYEYSQSGAKLYGYEAELQLPLLRQSEHHLDVRIASDYVRGKLDNGEDLPLIPPLRVGLGLHFESGAWHLGIEGFHSFDQKNVNPGELRTDSHTQLELDASYRLAVGDLTLLTFIRGTNLLDEDIRLATSPLKDIAPLPGRSLHLGVRAQW